jgi:hypothetical protein
MTTINHHLAEQMGLPHEDRDGRCFLLTVDAEWDLLGDSQLSKAQRAIGFAQWARSKGLPSDPTAAAIATGYKGE